MAVAESGDVPERPVPVTEGLAASAVPADPAAAQAACDWDAGRALAELYAMHYQALVRLAALLVRDTATANGRHDDHRLIHEAADQRSWTKF